MDPVALVYELFAFAQKLVVTLLSQRRKLIKVYLVIDFHCIHYHTLSGRQSVRPPAKKKLVRFTERQSTLLPKMNVG